MENTEKKVTVGQLETALNRVKDETEAIARKAAEDIVAPDDTATDTEVKEMLDRVFGTKTEGTDSE